MLPQLLGTSCDAPARSKQILVPVSRAASMAALVIGARSDHLTSSDPSPLPWIRLFSTAARTLSNLHPACSILRYRNLRLTSVLLARDESETTATFQEATSKRRPPAEKMSPGSCPKCGAKTDGTKSCGSCGAVSPASTSSISCHLHRPCVSIGG